MTKEKKSRENKQTFSWIFGDSSLVLLLKSRDSLEDALFVAFSILLHDEVECSGSAGLADHLLPIGLSSNATTFAFFYLDFLTD